MICVQFLSNIIRENKPELVLMGATRKGNLFGPMVSPAVQDGPCDRLRAPFCELGGKAFNNESAFIWRQTHG